MKKIFLLTTFIVMIFSINVNAQNKDIATEKKVSLTLFWTDGCVHCKKEKIFLEKIKQNYPFLEIHDFNISRDKNNREELNKYVENLKIKNVYLPLTIIQNKYYIVGFQDENTTGKKIENMIIAENQKINHIDSKPNGKITIPEYINAPFIGEVKIKTLSLPILTVLLGAVDGFNPCAMWVLIMLLSFLIAVNDKKKLIIYGSIFIVTSSLVYFLFMVAWLNIIFAFGAIFWIRLIIGIVSISAGIYYLKEFFTNKENVCKVTKTDQKKKISEKISFYINNKGFYLASLAIIILAFLVNLIELVCSIGLPVIYTQILSMSALSTFKYYMFISLYIFIFMLDNIIVFLIAIFTLKLTNISNKYCRYSHLIGGSLLNILGLLLILKPGWLSFN